MCSSYGPGSLVKLGPEVTVPQAQVRKAAHSFTMAIFKNDLACASALCLPCFKLASSRILSRLA